MSNLSHQNLFVEGMVRIHRVINAQMEVTKNEHAKLFIRGIAMDDEELGDITDQLLSPTLGSKFTLYRYEEDKKIPIFSGLVENVNLESEKGIDYFKVEVISASILFDRKKRKRSFQNVNMTYEELALQVVSDYGGGATICTVGSGTAIGTPMIQYNETDWEFLKRLASHFESPIYADYITCSPRIWFGFPTQMNMVDISEQNYIYGQDQSYFDIVNNDKDMDFRYIETKTYDNYEIGSGTEFKERSYHLYQKYGILDKGELIFTYRFGSTGLKQSPKFYNDAISGMSLLGEVAKDDKEDVYVKLDIDNGGGGTYPYPFRPETGNMMYCMPQVGTKVSLYFPNFDEKNAMVVNCFRTNGGECADTSDPSKRAFNTEHGKALTLHPSTMSLSSTSGSSILFDDDKGITFNSAKNTVFYAMGGIQFNAPNVNFKSPLGEILALKMDASMEITESSVSMCSQFDILGKNGTILTGTVFVHYEPFDDAPMEKSFLGSVFKNFVIGALVAVACVAAAILIPGLGALAVGALMGAAVGTVVMTGQALATGESKSTAEAVREIAINTVCGAIGGMIPGSGLLMFGVGGAIEGTVDRALRGEEITLKTLAFDFALSAITAGALDGIGRKILGKAGKEGAEELADNVVDKIGKEVSEELSEKIGKESIEEITEKVTKNTDEIIDTSPTPKRNDDLSPPPKDTDTPTKSNCESGHDPVNMVTGSFMIEQCDFIINDILGDVAIERFYESVSRPMKNIIGQGWILSIFSFLEEYRNLVLIHMPDHTVESFDKVNDRYVSRRDGDETYTLTKIETGHLLFHIKTQKSVYFRYDGQIEKIIDRFGNVTNYEYVQDTISRILFSSGQYLNFKFNNGKVSEITDNINRKIKYEYSGDFLLKVTIPNGGSETYEYDDKGYILSVTNANGVTYVKNEYDLNGRIVKQNLSNGQEYFLQYDDKNRVNTSITPSMNREVKYQYNHLSLVKQIVYQDGSYELFDYDKWQNKSYKRDRMGNETFYEYNQNGLLLKEILPSGLITEFEYDEGYNLIKEWDNSGKEHIFTYNSKGNLINSVAKINDISNLVISYSYDNRGRVLAVADPNGNVERYVYNTKFNKPSIFKSAMNQEISYTYDDAGRCYSLSNERGQKEFGYNSMDLMCELIDENENITKYTYDKLFNLTHIMPPNISENSKAFMLGEQFTYDDFNNKILTRNGIGNILATPRDLEGNIVKEINPNTYDMNTKDGVGIAYEYDEYDRRIKTIYPDGSIERLKYDFNGNIVKRIQPENYDRNLDDGKGFSYEYDSSDRLVQVSDPNGIVTKRYVYDLKGNIIKEIDANGFKTAEMDEERIGTTYVYNLLNWLLEKRTPVTTKNGEVCYSLVTYSYDNAGNMTTEKRYIEYQSDISYIGDIHTIMFTYDKDNRRTKVSDCTGAVMEYEYNSSNQITFEKRKINNDNYHNTYYTYDKAGRLIEVRATADETGCGKKSVVTKYEYDKNGNITKITTPSGNMILREYDLCDRIISETHKENSGNINNRTAFAYDKAGNLISITDNQGRQTEIQYDLLNREIRTKEKDGSITRKFYDKNSNLSKVVRPNQYDELTDNGKGYSYTYNDRGQVLTIISPTGSILQSNTYDDNGNLITQVDGQNSGVDFIYDLSGNRLNITTKGGASQDFEYDARGNIIGIFDGEKNRTDYTLDKWGRITTIQKADGSHERYTYDYAGNMLSSTDGEGYKTEYEYTKTGQVSKIIDPMGEFESYAYDEENRLKRKVDRNGNVVDLAYNMYGNITSKTALNSDLFEKFTYSVDGMLESAISNGMHYSYTYDVMNRLASKKSSGRTLIAYEYDKNGNKIKETSVTGNVTETSYNELDKPVKICYNGVDIASYDYFENGLKKSLTNGLITQTFGYDADYNLTSLEVKNGASLLADNHYKYDRNGNRTEKQMLNGVISYDYNNVGQLQKVDYPTYSEELFYDKRGNRTSRIKNGAEELYSYDPRNRLTQLTKNGQTYSFEYDNAGNLKKDDKANYFYNEFNQTTKVETFDGNVQINRYDVEGLRYEMEENNRLVQFIFNTNREVVAENSDKTWKNYIRTSELLFSSADHDRTYYHYASDEMGSITHITQGENVLNEYEYNAWGEVTHSVEKVENRFKFNGQQLDPITGQYYLRARFYNPVIARFTQEDTYRGDGLNLYAYCRNNPVYYIDPTGHLCEGKASVIREKINNNTASDIEIKLLQHYDEIQLNGIKDIYDPKSVNDLYSKTTGDIISGHNVKEPSVMLAHEMNAAGVPKPQFPTEAHHIIPAKQAPIAVEHLELLGINVNSSANGVRLPSINISGNPQTIHSQAFSGMMYHGNDYIVNITEQITSCTTKSQALDVLNNLRYDLLSGKLDIYL